MNRFLLSVALLAMLVISACSETAPLAQTPATAVYTISGRLRFDKQITIPSNARVLVAWNDSNGSMYIFGEGTVDMADSTFKVTFDDIPPSNALQPQGIGVGFIILTSNQSMSGRYVGRTADSVWRQGFLGGAAKHAVVYLKGPPDSLALQERWATHFRSGFNTGRAFRKFQGHDELEWVEPNTIELIIDDAGEIEWLNWT